MVLHVCGRGYLNIAAVCADRLHGEGILAAITGGESQLRCPGMEMKTPLYKTNPISFCILPFSNK